MVTAKQVINSIKPKKQIGLSGKTQPGQIGYDNVRDDIERVKKCRVLIAEQIGVGTESPTAGYNIHIKQAGNAIMVLENSTWSKTFFMKAGTAQIDFGALSNDTLALWSGGDTAITMDSSRNVTVVAGTLNMNTHKILNVVDPTTDQEAATKKYVDDQTHLELGETSTTAYRGDRGKTAYDHSQDNTQAHSDYLKNDAVDVGVGLTLTGDNSSADTAYVPMVLYNTDDTPPAASGFPIGTIYIQYTA